MQNLLTRYQKCQQWTTSKIQQTVPTIFYVQDQGTTQE